MSKEKGKELADEYGLTFLETSAMNNVNVDEAFLSLTKAVKARVIDTQEQEQERSRAIHLQPTSYDRIKTSCCFGGGGQSSSSSKSAKAIKAPKSPARSVKSAKSVQ